MQSAMTSRERITAALLGRNVDHLPFCPFLAYVWESFPREFRDQGPLAFHRLVGADPLWRGAPCAVRAIPPESLETHTREDRGRTIQELRTPVGALRLAWAHSEAGQTRFLTEHPLKTEADFKVQLWVEEHTRLAYDAAPVTAHFAGDGGEGLSLGMLIPRGKSAFQSLVEHWVGTEELVYALADFPGTVEALWQAMVANDMEAVRLAVQSPYEFLITWEDSSTQNYSPSQFDRYIGAEIGDWCRVLSAHGRRYIQHACGHVGALVGRMQAHGVHAVESISPPPTGNISIRDARQIAGTRMGIIGGIEPTRFLQLSLKQLGPYVESVIAEGAGGPFVLANSDSCPPGVAVEKFRLVADIAKSARDGSSVSRAAGTHGM